MNKQVLQFIAAMGLIVALSHFSAFAQLNIQLTGQNVHGQYVQLHHAVIEDVTQGWSDTLFYPDTILVLSGVGMEDYERVEELTLLQNTPNPFDGVTDFTLMMPNEDKVVIEVFDMAGRKVTDMSQRLSAGAHTFRVWLNTPQQYVLMVRTTRKKVSIKMMNNGAGGGSHIAYNGEYALLYSLKFSRSDGYEDGDLLRIIGFRLLDGQCLSSDTVEITTIPEETVVLTFSTLDEISPYVATGAVTSITRNTAVCSGEVLSEGLATMTERGFCWDTLPDPTLAASYVAVGAGIGAFSVMLTELTAGTSYYCRAYATNAYATVYGETVTFTTDANVAPSLTTMQASSITDTSAIVGGMIMDDGGLPVLERGICWGLTGSPTLADSHVATATVSDSFSCALADLITATHYYARAYAINAVGTGYGNVVDFTTEIGLPAVALDSITNIGSSYATCHGELLTDGGDTTTVVGLCWSANPMPTVADNHVEWNGAVGAFHQVIGSIHDLLCYVRPYATNAAGTVYGNILSFAPDTIPTSVHLSLVHLDHNYATMQVTVVCDSTAAISNRGLCLDTLPQPDLSNRDFPTTSADNAFDILVDSLERASTYYLRGYCVSNGTLLFSDDYLLLTVAEDGQPCIGTPTLTDYEGHVYNTVQVGSQCWMRTNLYTTHYTDGAAIPYGSTGAGVYSMYNPYYYELTYNTDLLPTYGYAYNWKALTKSSTTTNVNVQGICPDGWHIPDASEFGILRDYTGVHYACGEDSNSVAKALADVSGWNTSTANCSPGAYPSDNNLTGFSAYPSGAHYEYTYQVGEVAYIWSRTNDYSFNSTPYYSYAHVFKITNNGQILAETSYIYYDRAYPVRCLRNE